MSFAVFVVVATGVVAVHAQSPTFEVASVKRAVPAGRGIPATAAGPRGISVQPGGRFMAPSSTVRELIAAAYGLQDIQIVGGPEWMANDRFEVMATTKGGASVADARAMLGTLLTDRFRLTAHRETRELPVSLLSMAREDRQPGPQLRPSGAECAPMKGPGRGSPGPAFVAAPPPPPPPPPPGAGPVVWLDAPPLKCPSMAVRLNGGGHWSLRFETMTQFAQRLTGELGRPVVDRTGLTGPYDFDLTFASDVAVLAVAGPTDTAPLNTAVRDQLGLRLESSRAPVDVLVIDRVEQPTEN
jgi:uncharacterized protein (TIGR03435 family)